MTGKRDVGQEMTTSTEELDPTERRVDAGSLSLGCLVYGSEAAPPVVMFHGHTETAWSLDLVARSLADRYRVFSFDLRGHGRSDWGAYTLPHMAGDVRGVIESLALESPIVVGHSLGGHAAGQFCGLYPEIPSKLILIEALGPPPYSRAKADPAGHHREYMRRIVETIRQPAHSRPSASMSEAVARFRRAHPLLDGARAELLVEKNTRELVDGSFEWRFDPEIRDWLAGHDQARAEQRWGGITCPTLAISGANAWETFWQPRLGAVDDLDGPTSPEELQRRLEHFEDVAHVEIAGAGHMVHYDKPAELNEAIARFLPSP